MNDAWGFGMTDIKELRENIDRLNRSNTTVSKRQSYDMLMRTVKDIESELEAARKELSVNYDKFESLKKENLSLKNEYNILNNSVHELLKEKTEVEKKLEKISKSRPQLSSADLVKTFSNSLEKMDETVNKGASRVNYSVSSMNVRLMTNLAVQDNELRFQLPGADDIIPPANMSQVEFTISSSAKEPPLSELKDVPEVVGLDVENAHSRLKAAGFVQGEVEEKDSSLVQGTVLSQIPSGRSIAKPGDEVDLVISRITSVKVPYLVGMPQEAAEKALNTSRLVCGMVTEQEDSSRQGMVISQSIAAGELADTGTEVDLVVGGPKTEFSAVSGAKKEVATKEESDNATVGAVKGTRQVLSSNPSIRLSPNRRSRFGKE